MCNIFPIPLWFAGPDLAIEAAIFILTLLITFFSYSVFRVAPDKKIKLLCVAFGAFSVATLMQASHRFVMLFLGLENACKTITLQNVFFLTGGYTLIYILLSLVAIILFLYLTLKAKERVFWLVFITSIVSILLSRNILPVYFALGTIFLGFCTLSFVSNAMRMRKKTATAVALAFAFLTIAWASFTFAWVNPTYYVYGHVFELIGLVCILANLLMVFYATKR